MLKKFLICLSVIIIVGSAFAYFKEYNSKKKFQNESVLNDHRNDVLEITNKSNNENEIVEEESLNETSNKGNKIELENKNNTSMPENKNNISVPDKKNNTSTPNNKIDNSYNKTNTNNNSTEHNSDNNKENNKNNIEIKSEEKNTSNSLSICSSKNKGWTYYLKDFQKDNPYSMIFDTQAEAIAYGEYAAMNYGYGYWYSKNAKNYSDDECQKNFWSVELYIGITTCTDNNGKYNPMTYISATKKENLIDIYKYLSNHGYNCGDKQW